MIAAKKILPGWAQCFISFNWEWRASNLFFFYHHLTAFIAAVLGHTSESSSQTNENQAEDWALCPRVQQHRSVSLPGCSSGCHAQLWPLPAFQPFVVSWALQAGPPWFFQLIPYLWVPILPAHDMGPVSLFLLPSSALWHCWCSAQDGASPAPLPSPIIPFRPIRPDSTPLSVHPHRANTKRGSCLLLHAGRTQEAVLAARPFLKALSDAVCKPSSTSGWMEVPQSSRSASASDPQGCAVLRNPAVLSSLSFGIRYFLLTLIAL